MCRRPSGCSSQASDCPAPAKPSSLMKMYNKRCLEFVLGRPDTRIASEQDCERRGGHLVDVDSEPMQRYLESVLRTRYVGTGVWIGLTASNNQWTWTSGATGNYTNWASGSTFTNVFGSHKDCVYMATGTWKWHKAVCSSSGFLVPVYVTLNYVCEFRTLSSTEVTVGPQHTTKAPTSNACPYTITRHSSDTFSFGANTYQLTTLPAQGVDAKKSCGTKGGNLVTIPDWVSLMCLRDGLVKVLRFSGHDVWIGLSDAETEGQWKWDNGETYSYHHWGGGEPGSLLGTNEDCVVMETTTGFWKDFSCTGGFLFGTTRFPYLCQFSNLTPSTSPSTATTSPANPSTTTTTTKTTTTTTTTTATTSSITAATSVKPCPMLEACTLDCGLSGFKKDNSGCHICACDD
ncbi:macrophage mannose receptor 1-like isoform X2 [Haliotis asinina]|uniref:macrophage mannose receptor 1-like isoform X2 n=1 Tax=Haliotis asinina TaxID=109174 RepID=UPI0035322CCC